MPLFVKDVAGKQQFPVFFDATVDIAMPSPCTSSSHAVSVKVSQWRIWEKKLARTRHQNAFAARNNEAHRQGNGRQSFSVQSFAVIKNTGILLLAVFTQELEMDHPSETSLFSDFFWEKGAAVHRLSEADNPSSNCLSKLMDEVRRIVHLKLKPFHFQIKTYYLADPNYQTDNPSHTNNRASIKPGTWNIPEHSGTFRNIPEHPGTWKN